MTSINNIWKQLTSILSNLNDFHSLEVVDRVSETQLQVGENSDWLIRRLKGWVSFLWLGSVGVQYSICHRDILFYTTSCIISYLLNAKPPGNTVHYLSRRELLPRWHNFGTLCNLYFAIFCIYVLIQLSYISWQNILIFTCGILKNILAAVQIKDNIKEM